MTYRGVAFENFTGERVTPNYVIAKDLKFADYSDKPEAVLIEGIENAIKFEYIDFPYYSTANNPNETVLIMTAITKRERYESGTIGLIWEENTSKTGTLRSSDYCAGYTWKSRDMEENFKRVEYIPPEFSGGTPPDVDYNFGYSCTEVTYIRLEDKIDYTDGLFSFAMFGHQHTIPAIPFIMTVKNVAGVDVTDVATPFYKQ
jgi:hypothetical protein